MRAPPVDLAKHMREKAIWDEWRARAVADTDVMRAFLDSRSKLSGHKPWREVLCERARDEYAEGRIDLEALERRIDYALTR